MDIHLLIGSQHAKKVFTLENLFCSTDVRNSNGFWLPYAVYGLWAKFECDLHGEDACVWASRQVQVELKVS